MKTYGRTGRLYASPKEQKFWVNYLSVSSPTFGNCSRSSVAAGLHWRTGWDVVRRHRESGTYQKILEAVGLSDGQLAQIHRELLSSDNEYIKLRALELAYKISGKISGTHKIDVQGEVTRITEKRLMIIRAREPKYVREVKNNTELDKIERVESDEVER